MAGDSAKRVSAPDVPAIPLLSQSNLDKQT
jgi:hypothetical protein